MPGKLNARSAIRRPGESRNLQAAHDGRSLHFETLLSLKKAIVVEVMIKLTVMIRVMSIAVGARIEVVSLLLLQVEEEFSYIDDKLFLCRFSEWTMAMLLILLLLFCTASILCSRCFLLFLWCCCLGRFLLLFNRRRLLSWLWCHWLRCHWLLSHRLHLWGRLLLLSCSCWLLLCNLLSTLITSNRNWLFIKW